MLGDVPRRYLPRPDRPGDLSGARHRLRRGHLGGAAKREKYLADMEAALKCFSATHNDAGYNNAVEDMQKIATAFNGVLRAYRTRQQKS